MIQRRQRPTVDPFSTAPAFSHILEEFARLLPWADRAACKDEDPELWTSHDRSAPGGKQLGNTVNQQRIHLAKAICARCPVREQCLSHALSWPEEFHIWGGLLPYERRAMGKSRRGARSKSA